MRRFLEKSFAFLASFGLAITVLSFLLVLTVVGTVEQTRTSLYEVQRRYFESAFVVHDLGGIPVPLPGVYLLLVVLAINLVCGGIVRIRKSRSTAGIIVAHAGILFLLSGSLIEYQWSQKGHTTLAEGTETGEFQSYFEWEIAIAEARSSGRVEEHVIPGAQFMGLREGEKARFVSPAIPFELAVNRVFANCEPRAARAAGAGSVDGVALEELPPGKEAESDVAGAYVTVRPKSGGAPVEGLLWGLERYPMSVVVEGRRWTIGLSHRRWQLPFSIHLDDFRQQLHPGTGMAKAFESDVTKTRDGVRQKVKISMNEPLRESGYTLYQSSFIKPSQGGGRWWSTFSVVKNPADRVPLWACVVITAGLLLHFAQQLIRHVRAQTEKRA
ncbi:MAG: cytochrome c biogenesis protein ResB [Planctomycetes bacterium]|nr:cytochrome c biogenesis protein ResB [Planctomycetota bacterium]